MGISLTGIHVCTCAERQGHPQSIPFVLCLGSRRDMFSSAIASWPCRGAALSPLLLTGVSHLPSVVSPVHLQCNQIHHGLRSGIVVLGNGKGILRNNQIFSNKEAGIYILYHGNPVVRYVCASVLRPPCSPMVPFFFFHLWFPASCLCFI